MCSASRITVSVSQPGGPQVAYSFVLPDLGEGIHEGEIIKWHVDVGNRIEENQVLLEVETDKAAVEIPSPVAGYVLERRGNEGEIVKVGTVLVVVGSEEELAQKAKPLPAERRAAAPAAEKAKPAPAEPGKKGRKALEEEAIIAEAAAAERSAAGVAEKTVEAAGMEGEVLATPSVRKLARELGVDISRIVGSGRGGRITAEDVRAAKEAPVEARVSETAPVPGVQPEEHVPVRSLRRKIAEKMKESWATIPHVTHVEEVEVSRLVRLRNEMGESLGEEDTKLTYLSFILKALVPALKQFPQFNATFDEKAEEIVLKRYYNIGIATATEAGLMVPVVKNVDRKSILELSKEIVRLATEARTRKIALDDLRGGTFSVTNYGSVGGLFGTPIINYPEVAVLGIGRIHKRAFVVGRDIEVGDCLYLSLSFDHRITDGKEAADFVNVVKKYLENPNLLFLEMA